MAESPSPTHTCDVSACMVGIADICHCEKWLHSADYFKVTQKKILSINGVQYIGPQEDVSGSLY